MNCILKVGYKEKTFQSVADGLQMAVETRDNKATYGDKHVIIMMSENMVLTMIGFRHNGVHNTCFLMEVALSCEYQIMADSMPSIMMDVCGACSCVLFILMC